MINIKNSDEYYLWADDIEANWRKSLPLYRENEWVDIFPEIRSIAPAKIRELEKLHDEKGDQIRCKLLDIRKRTKDPPTREFLIAWVKHTDGVVLTQIGTDIRRFKTYIPYPKKSTSDITPEKITQALEYPVVDLVNRYTNVRRAGKHYIALCPFHNERSPSFVLYLETNSAYCFGCNAGGDTIELIRKLERLTFPEAINELTGVLI